ncbi:MAG TPA: hypothetical protein PLQ35_02850 [bacterium]|nr:hypothetical protein [bacterium]HQL61211.1 hypothetical protein [bacterium]
MELQEIIRLLNAEPLVAPEPGHPSSVHDVCAADLLSDILATKKRDFVILTGLVTPQVIRVAEATDALGVVIVRGKTPPEATLEAARKSRIPVWRCSMQLFESCVALAPLIEEKRTKEGVAPT